MLQMQLNDFRRISCPTLPGLKYWFPLVLPQLLSTNLILYVYGSATLPHEPLDSSLLTAAPPSTKSINTQASWEFNHGLEGWGQATSNELQGDLRHMSDEIHMTVLGPEPHLDSPRFEMDLQESYVFAMRYRFVGKSTFGKIHLRGSETMMAEGMARRNTTSSSTIYGWEAKDLFSEVYFPIQGDGLWHIAYAKIDWNHKTSSINVDSLKTAAIMLQMRLWPACERDSNNTFEQSLAPHSGNVFHIDWIRIVQGPVIHRVTGCSGNKYFKTELMEEPILNVESQVYKINGVLSRYRTVWTHNTGQEKFPFASSYNCLRQGGETITIEGIHFGGGGIKDFGAPAHVYIDGRPCLHVTHDEYIPEKQLTCITPAMESSDMTKHWISPSVIELYNGILPGLVVRSQFFQYAVPPPSPQNLTVSNVASR